MSRYKYSKNQGVVDKTALKGIVRNTSDATCEDGEMDEVVNMRYKDAHWKPCGELKQVEGVGLDGSLQTFIHTNDTYHHVLVAQNNALWWVANVFEGGERGEMKANAEKLMDVKGNVYITQTGNLLSVTSEAGMDYVLYDMGTETYTPLHSNYNDADVEGGFAPEGLIDFRMDADVDSEGRAKWGHTLNILSVPVDLYGSKREAIGNVTYASQLSAIEAARKSGWWTGVFLVRYALKLYDGTYIFPSRPLLMNAPWIKETYENAVLTEGNSNKEYDLLQLCDKIDIKHWKDDGSGTTIDERSSALFHDFNIDYGREGFEEDVEEYKNASTQFYQTPRYQYVDMVKINKNGKVYRVPSTTHYKRCHIRYNKYRRYKNIITHIHYTKKKGLAICRSYITRNTLQIRFNSAIASEYKDIIDSVCIFATKQISIYNHELLKGMTYMVDTNTKFDPFVDNTYGTAENKFIASFAIETKMPIKEKDKIMEEIDMISSFNLISEIKFDQVVKGDWQDVSIKPGVLATIEEQEWLTTYESGRNVMQPKTSWMYNGRMHIANYTERKFDGYPIEQFYHYAGRGQINEKELQYISTLGRNEPVVEIKVWLKTDKGNVVVQRLKTADYNCFIGMRLNPMLSYPDNRAYKMSIRYQDNAPNLKPQYYYREFPLRAHPYLNFSYYIEQDLSPIEIEWIPNIVPPAIGERENNEEQLTNNMRVSTTENPLYFPPQNSYKIGNGTILGGASNATALSQGQVGDAPMFVFCSDGVYGLFVDSSGQLAYSVARPISRDVCNNQRSITPIDGSILFTTDRGLMAIEGTKTTDISNVAEGYPFDVTKDLMKDGELKCIDHPVLVELTDAISQENILEYMKDAVMAYNYFDKEIWLSNASKGYSYVMCQGIWTKRTEVAERFVMDYPNVYVLRNGAIYNLSKEREGVRETMMLTRPIKYNDQNYKQTYRSILRGYFKLGESTILEPKTIDLNTLWLDNATEDLHADPLENVNDIKVENDIYKEVVAKEKNIRTMIGATENVDMIYHIGKTVAVDSENMIANYLVNNGMFLITFAPKDGVGTLASLFHEVVVTPNSTDVPLALLDNYKMDIIFTMTRTMEFYTYTNGSVSNVKEQDVTTRQLRASNKNGTLVITGTPTVTAKSTDVTHNQCRVKAGSLIKIEWQPASDYVDFKWEINGEFTPTMCQWKVIKADGVFPNRKVVTHVGLIDDYESIVSEASLTNGAFKRMGDSSNIELDMNENEMVRVQIYDKGTDKVMDDVMVNDSDEAYIINMMALWHKIDRGEDISPLRFATENEKIDNVDVGFLSTDKKVLLKWIDGREYFKNVPKYYRGLQNYPKYIKLFDLYDKCSNDEWSNASKLKEPFQFTLFTDKVYRFFENGKVLGIYKYTGITTLHSWNRIKAMIGTRDLLPYDKKGEQTLVELRPYTVYRYEVETDIWQSYRPEQTEYKFLYIGAGEMVELRNLLCMFDGVREQDVSCILFRNEEEYKVYSLRLWMQNYMVTMRDGEIFRFISSDYPWLGDIDGKVYKYHGYGAEDTISLSDLLMRIQDAEEYIPEEGEIPKIGWYIFGSHDGRKWACLGGNERSGEMRDIGLLAMRTDCKFIRYLMVGKLHTDSVADYIETTLQSELLRKKIR